MSFFSQIANAAGLSESSLSGGYNMINYNGEAVYVEGLVRLITVDESLIKMELSGAIGEISGDGLYIFELSDCLIVKGKIANLNCIPYKNSGRRRNEKQAKNR